MTGLFITLEGGEGSGKSTVAAELARRLEAEGHTVTLTEEPGGTELGRHFWTYLRGAGEPLSPLAELMLFEAARADHVDRVIRPALDAGRVVVCDRFIDSSVAYQGYGRGLGRALVESLNEMATGGLRPDITLLLDVPVETGLQRARSLEAGDGAVKSRDSIGGEAEAFHQRVRDGFLAISEAEPGRVARIDADRPLDEVSKHCWRRVREVSASRS
ncbi:MAG TPA: dTMP kinase [Dehalococcoidia bacterium]